MNTQEHPHYDIELDSGIIEAGRLNRLNLVQLASRQWALPLNAGELLKFARNSALNAWNCAMELNDTLLLRKAVSHATAGLELLTGFEPFFQRSFLPPLNKEKNAKVSAFRDGVGDLFDLVEVMATELSKHNGESFIPVGTAVAETAFKQRKSNLDQADHLARLVLLVLQPLPDSPGGGNNQPIMVQWRHLRADILDATAAMNKLWAIGLRKVRQ